MYNPKIVRGNVSLVMLEAQLRRAKWDWDRLFAANEYTLADEVAEWIDNIEDQIKQLKAAA